MRSAYLAGMCLANAYQMPTKRLFGEHLFKCRGFAAARLPGEDVHGAASPACCMGVG